jgi:hypothetical protein
LYQQSHRFSFDIGVKMDQALQDTLFEKHPTLFVNKDEDIRNSCMAWGIECGNGWHDIISSLCWMIQQREDNIKSRQEYLKKQDKNIQKDLNINIIGEEVEYFPVRFDQIKEKFGGLRIYFTGGDDYVEGLVSMAESFSYQVCELCGEKGKPNKNGWISTLCEKCRSKT